MLFVFIDVLQKTMWSIVLISIYYTFWFEISFGKNNPKCKYFLDFFVR